MSTLKEQVSKVKPGDKITAQFKDKTAGEFTITGTVYEPSWGGQLDVAGWPLTREDDLVAIVEHVPVVPTSIVGALGRVHDDIKSQASTVEEALEILLGYQLAWS